MDIFSAIQAAGNTVVLVTHEEDIAAYAKRVVRLRDGVIESDTTAPKEVLKSIIFRFFPLGN